MTTFAENLVAARPRLRKYALHLTRSTDAADDLTQDALTRAWVNRDKFEGNYSQFVSWLVTIAHNYYLQQQRSINRKTFAVEPLDQIISPERADIGVMINDMRKALAVVEPKRCAYVIAAAMGYEGDEIAQQYNVPLGTVRSSLARGRAIIQEYINGDFIIKRELSAEERKRRRNEQCRIRQAEYRKRKNG